jgi:ADP-heptose:LPS heptosyltransferase
LNQVHGQPGGLPHIDCPAKREDFAVIHPFASNLKKRWALEKFREVARRLNMPVRWCAGPEEPLDAAVRIANLYELGCWLATARVYIGNDSGVSHLAAAVGTPTVVLFGPTDPAVWAPRGDRVRVLDRMESREPSDVLTAVDSI